jgi:hypothetical protein
MKAANIDMAKDTPAPVTPPRPYPADKARGGDIILRTPLQRLVFIAGLAGAVILALVLTFIH